MKILKSDLEVAARNGIITDEQARKLWDYFNSLRPEQPKFQGLHVLYYFGGVLILSSMSWFLTTAWNNGALVMGISGLFAMLYVYLGDRLWNRDQMKIPGGLLITAAVGLTPVFIYGLQKATGLWPEKMPDSDLNYRDYHLWIKGNWFFMELGTIIAAAVALRFYKFTFITFPLAVTLWYMSMDLTPLLFGKHEFTWDQRKIVSMIFGLTVLIYSYAIDRKNREQDFAFWTYIYGMLAFWGGLTALKSDSELSKFIYCMLNVGFIFFSVYIRRRVFLVFGTFGVLGYLSHLAWRVFKDSYSLPLVLAGMGLVIIYFGVKYQKNQARFEAFVEKYLPTVLLKWRPAERA